MSTYPVFLTDLEHRRAVILGNGDLAARKVLELADAGFGHVAVVSPAPSTSLVATARHPAVALHVRCYRESDLAGVTLAIATDRDAALNARLHRDAERANVLLVATDDVDHCTAFGGAMIRRGHLAIAIGTGGAAPALAVRVKQAIERILPDETAALLELAADLRPWIADAITDFHRRRTAWYAVIDDALLRSHLAAGRSCAARGRAIAIVVDHARERGDLVLSSLDQADDASLAALAGTGGVL